MAMLSKELFESACGDVPCNHIVHPWNKSCLWSTPETYLQTSIGSVKFYSIIYVAQLLMQTKKWKKKEFWKKMGEYYLRSTLLGAAVTGTYVNLSCLIRWMLGNKFTYYTYNRIPFTLTGLYIYLEPPSRRGLIINLFFNLLVEYYLRSLQRAGYLEITKARQTLLFMVGSSLLFYLMRLEGDKEQRTPLFWLYTPEKVRRKEDGSKNVCPHEGSCRKYILRGYANYFGIGLAISLARLIIPKIKTPIEAISSIRSKHFKMALFFGSYIGIYRAVVCYLCRKQGVDSALYALPAGYLAGLSSLFNSSLGLSIAVFSGALKLFSTILYEKKILPDYIPLPELLYCYCQGSLFHARFMDPDICPNYVFNLMKTVSNTRCEWVFNNIMEVVKNVQ
ncbi:transmembrane protein 135-like [Achroia grisella]|uniref:transmembrane protein 135-like n=1 Tax=Achroia grisella TaxID=688607 RepID=UPI0027D30171|nr:transmembrane protein 135-like [Achroia grisella]XP_059058648.1 transmembrane protein 135-like [Achroia grisella]XP_059058649.1 transmembrane protein 135-like [Achroia grisella]XP_059058650.1 transmembrane protein 135-like [Achroia grisella]